ncbi:M15 family metallopeptidase [Nocardioides aequoreus]|uniref:M15 family metallopeptidase n=1 Tax=Nocardioides aequoreus TaxID=397278 RepID=UPI000AE26820|nr:M15 family metallopeptidase [Nocardioides aequoreus]
MPAHRSGRRLVLVLLLCAALGPGAVLPASAADPADEPPVAPVAPVATTIRLGAPTEVVDERAVQLRARFLTSAGEPVAGALVVFDRVVDGAWRRAKARRTDATGLALYTVKPRRDTRWRVRGLAGERRGVTWQAATSASARIENVPPARPVSLGGPRPDALPTQARAVGRGANAVVHRISDRVWRSMVGRSWRQGCPVGRGGLRLVRVNYYGFDGYRYRGEIVVNQAVARRAARAFGDMHARKLPLRAMYRVDRFGWSRELQGADDRASMAADNTSGFNCRQVVGRPGVRSPHSTGRSIDINPWENPYWTSAGWVPNTWWVGRSHPRVAWRSGSHAVLKIWRSHGFRWTYGVRDAHHLDGRTAPGLEGGLVG